jgi:hypothetical protein
MTTPAKKYGGVLRAWEAPTPNPSLLDRIIGKKNAMA